jgi:hypothetical protein
MITRREFVIGFAGAAAAGKLALGDTKEDLVAACGLYCGACPMYLATQSKDEEKVKAVLKQFSARNSNMKAEDLLCDGCLGTGKLASFCRSCQIRDSASKKTKTRRCSECSEFACGRITSFNNDGMLHHAEVLANLKQLQKVGIREWAKREEERWRCPRCKAPVAWYDPACSKCGAARSDNLFPLKKA